MVQVFLLPRQYGDLEHAHVVVFKDNPVVLGCCPYRVLFWRQLCRFVKAGTYLVAHPSLHRQRHEAGECEREQGSRLHKLSCSCGCHLGVPDRSMRERPGSLTGTPCWNDFHETPGAPRPVIRTSRRDPGQTSVPARHPSARRSLRSRSARSPPTPPVRPAASP